MLFAGIHEDLNVNVTFNEKDGYKNLVFELGQQKSLEELLTSTSSEVESGPTKLMMFGVNTTDWEGNTKEGSQILKELSKTNAKYMKFLKVFMAEDDISWNILTGLDGLSTEQLNKPEVLGLLNNNIVDEMLKNWNNVKDKSKKVRVKLVRQSKTKHFPKFPDLGDYIESMEIEPELSKLKFSDWEIENGYDSTQPYQSDSDDVDDSGMGDLDDIV